MSLPTVLALDLSTTRGVIAVVRGESVLFQASFTAERSHNAQVFTPLQQALAAIGKNSARIAIGTGPGSYTGVRIAIAAAQGVALSRAWPIIGWPSIATAQPADYQVLGDARRGMFYSAAVTQHGLGEIQLLDAAGAQALVSDGGVWKSFDAKLPLGLAEVELVMPDAVCLAQIVGGLSEAEVQTHAARPLEPIYLQEAFITVAKKAGKAVPLGRSGVTV